LLIKPLSQELIGKLEVAIARRNRDRAIAVLDQALELEKQRPTITDETPLVELFSLKEANVLESAGLIYLCDLRRADVKELQNCRGIGSFLTEKIKSVLLNLNTSSKPINQDGVPYLGTSVPHSSPS
jgi:hypothetical protein